MALILRYFAEFGSLRRTLRKVLDRAITMDNLRLLCLVKTTAEGPRDAHGINIL